MVEGGGGGVLGRKKKHKPSNYSGFTLCFWPNEVAVNCSVWTAVLLGRLENSAEEIGATEEVGGVNINNELEVTDMPNCAHIFPKLLLKLRKIKPKKGDFPHCIS